MLWQCGKESSGRQITHDFNLDGSSGKQMKMVTYPFVEPFFLSDAAESQLKQQQHEVDAPNTSIYLRKGPVGTQIPTIMLPLEEFNKVTSVGKMRLPT